MIFLCLLAAAKPVATRSRFGGDERVFRLAFVSNAPFEESEYGKWREGMEKAKHPLPSVEHCERKEKDVKEASRHRLTEADIDHIVREKKKFTKNPAKFAVTKTHLIKERVRCHGFLCNTILRPFSPLHRKRPHRQTNRQAKPW